jgi:PAS domain S-box-containing protein
MKEALGQSIVRFIPQRFRKAHAAHIQLFERGPYTKRRMGSLGEVIGLRANGEEFPIEASISKVGEGKSIRFTVILRDITERRMIEESLEKEEKFISTILDTTAALVVVLDPEWRIVRFNRVVENLIGRTVEEMRGKSFIHLAVVSGEDAPEIQNFWASFKGRQFPQSFENAWVDQNRQLRWIRWGNTRITDKKGKIENIIATGIDITQSKQAEQEIKRLWKHNESILNSAWEGIYGLDPYGKATFFNRSAERLTGWTAGEVQGQFLHPLLHHTKPDGRPYPWKKCPVYLSLTHGNIGSVDNEVLWRKDGTSFQVEYTSMPVHNDKKKVEGVVVTFRDITARKKADEALRASEERFQAFMSHSPTVAFLKDKMGHFIYVNLAFEKLLNKSSEECLGKTDQQLFPPEVARAFREHDRRVLKKREILEIEEITLDDKGNRRFWWVVKFPVQSKEGQLLLGGAALDISERKKIEEALEQRKTELQESQKMLQALGGKLISAQEDERRRISRELHDDMNQRLAVLAFNIQSAQKEKDTSPLLDQTLQKLYDGVSSLSDDVRHLAYQLHPSILDDLGLEVALQSFVDDFSKWEGIPVTFTASDMTDPLPQELASCLYRVAQEGMRNVSRHAQATQVDVRLIGVDGGVRLTIKDNGKGFEMKKGKSGKHGLGLIGMEERVRVVQGTYEVKSSPGQGTQVMVWVPIPKEESL